MIFIGCFAAVPANAQTEFKIGGYDGKAKGTMYLNKEHTQAQFRKIIVFTGANDPEVNRKVADAFKKIGVIAINGLQAFPPVKEYSQEDFENFYRAESIDGVIRSDIKGRTADDGMIITQMELSLIDVQDQSKVAVFIGHGLSMASEPDKGILKFFEGIIRELDSVLQENPDGEK